MVGESDGQVSRMLLLWRRVAGGTKMQYCNAMQQRTCIASPSLTCGGGSEVQTCTYQHPDLEYRIRYPKLQVGT